MLATVPVSHHVTCGPRRSRCALGMTRHNGPVPKIAAATVVENREQRKDALLKAAADLIQRRGAFTVAEVAKEVGLSRTAVYEYYASTGELVADVLIDEMTVWIQALEANMDPSADTRGRVHGWINGVLSYVIDGRHALLRSAATLELPQSRQEEVQRLHGSVISPLVETLRQAGADDPARDARYVWGIVDAAMTRIESGECEPRAEVDAVTAFVDRALASLYGRAQ